MGFMTDVRIGLLVGTMLLGLIGVIVFVSGGELDHRVVRVDSSGTTFEATWSQGCPDIGLGLNSCLDYYYCPVDSTGEDEEWEPRCDLCGCANGDYRCDADGICRFCQSPCALQTECSPSACTVTGDRCNPDNYECPVQLGGFVNLANDELWRVRGVQVQGGSTSSLYDDRYEDCELELVHACSSSEDDKFSGFIEFLDNSFYGSYCVDGVDASQIPPTPYSDVGDLRVYVSGTCEDEPSGGGGGEPSCLCEPCGTCEDPGGSGYYITSCSECGRECINEAFLC